MLICVPTGTTDRIFESKAYLCDLFIENGVIKYSDDSNSIQKSYNSLKNARIAKSNRADKKRLKTFQNYRSMNLKGQMSEEEIFIK